MLANRRLLELSIAFLSAAAGVIHLVVTESHWAENPLLGTALLMTGVGELTFGFLVIARPTSAVLIAGGCGEVVAITAWAWSRTVGLPFGLHELPEPVGVTDLTVVIFEVVALVIIFLLVAQGDMSAQSGYWRWLAVAPVVVVVAGLSSAAVALEPPDGHHAEAHTHVHADLAADPDGGEVGPKGISARQPPSARETPESRVSQNSLSVQDLKGLAQARYP